MGKWELYISIIICIVFLIPESISSHSGPFNGKEFKGRIAYSADGNFNDEDDWPASAVALAIFAEFGVQNKLVHFDYNCILPKSDEIWEKEHEISIKGSIKNLGYLSSVFHDCQKDLEGAVNSIKDAINASSADDPLYFILAGPMEVPYMGIQRSDPEKRKYVYCISHNVWNDGYASADLVDHNKRHVIPQGVTWVQITDQNAFLSTGPFGRPSTSEEWKPWTWLRDSENSDLNFLWDRLRSSTRADCSDSGMAYFLMTGDEESEISKIKDLLANNNIPQPLDPRQRIRIEAENFFALENFEIDYQNDRKVSQRINVKSVEESYGHIKTTFNEPYTADMAEYNVDIRYFDGSTGSSQFQFLINNKPVGDPWDSSENDNTWKTHSIADVTINDSDIIKVQITQDSGNIAKLDFVQLNLK